MCLYRWLFLRKCCPEKCWEVLKKWKLFCLKTVLLVIEDEGWLQKVIQKFGGYFFKNNSKTSWGVLVKLLSIAALQKLLLRSAPACVLNPILRVWKWYLRIRYLMQKAEGVLCAASPKGPGLRNPIEALILWDYDLACRSILNLAATQESPEYTSSQFATQRGA